tara:strand:+ start:72 stop:206 length:135 start_codon:yes stop_codon:yes gene_type:complete
VGLQNMLHELACVNQYAKIDSLLNAVWRAAGLQNMRHELACVNP